MNEADCSTTSIATEGERVTCRRASRRAVLRSAAAAGITVSAFAAGMPGRRIPSASAQGDSPLAGKTIDMSILGIAGWPPGQLGVSMATELFKPYAKENYGYDVNFSFEEAPFETLFQKAATSLSSESAQYNIIISDSQWLGALAEPGWIVQLNDIIAANPELDITFAPNAQQAYRVYPDGSDQLWGFPQEGDAIALYVRQDLMSDQAERDAYKAANDGEDLPQTFEEWEAVDIERYTRIAEFFTRPDEQLYGTGLQWSKIYDSLSCYAYPFIWSTGGQIWDPATGQVEGILDTEANAAALAMCKSLIPFAPPGATNFGIAEEVDAFTNGSTATIWQWAALGPSMLNQDQSPGAKAGDVADPAKPVTPDKVLIVPPPGFKQADGTLKRVYTLGGQPWVINAFNDEDHMQVAIDYMKFWYLPETQLEFSKRGGDTAVEAVLNDPGYDALQPHFRTYKYMLAVSQDFWHSPNYAEMLAAQQEAWSAYMTDVIDDPMQALKYTACKQQEILYDAEASEIEPSESCADVSIG